MDGECLTRKNQMSDHMPIVDLSDREIDPALWHPTTLGAPCSPCCQLVLQLLQPNAAVPLLSISTPPSKHYRLILRHMSKLPCLPWLLKDTKKGGASPLLFLLRCGPQFLRPAPRRSCLNPGGLQLLGRLLSFSFETFRRPLPLLLLGHPSTPLSGGIM